MNEKCLLKIMSFIFAAALIFNSAAGITAYAEEAAEEEDAADSEILSSDTAEDTESTTYSTSLSSISSGLLDIDIDGIYADLQTSLLSDLSFSLSDSLSSNSSLSVSGDSQYDLSNMTLITDTISDFGTTNLIYEELASSLADSTSLDMSEISSYSYSAEDIFSSTYGDVDASLTEYTLDIDTSELLSSMSESISSLYSDATSTDMFESAKDLVSISDLFSYAQSEIGYQEYDESSSKQASTLISDVQSASSSLQTTAKEQYDKDTENASAAASNYSSTAYDLLLNLEDTFDDSTLSNGISPFGTVDTETLETAWNTSGLSTGELTVDNQNYLDDIGSAINNAASSIGDVFSSATDIVSNYASGIADSVSDTVSNAADTVTDGLSSIADSITSGLNNIFGGN